MSIKFQKKACEQSQAFLYSPILLQVTELKIPLQRYFKTSASGFTFR